MKIKTGLLSCFMIIALAVFLSGAAMAAEDAKPSGTVDIKSKSIAIGVGVSWGEGVLKFQGKDYKFKLNGLSVVDLGVSSLAISGEVYNLKKVEDFEGKYMAGTAGVAVAGGGQQSTMKNQKDVTMKLKATQQGVKLTFAPEGISIKFVK